MTESERNEFYHLMGFEPPRVADDELPEVLRSIFGDFKDAKLDK